VRARLLVLALVVVTIAAACETAPVTGRRQVMLVGEPDEIKMGVDAYQQALQKSKVSRDAAVIERVTRVGRRIAEAAERPDYQWQFTVLDDPQINAWALPGGKIAVYTGILPVARDDAGLAAVLGHEVAHATARHGAERMSQTILVQTGLAATQVALANRDPLVVQGVTAALGAGASVGVLLPWGRAQESEADRIGLIYMAKAGYHPSAMRDLWIRMEEASRGQQRPPQFLSTHPSPATRIAQIESWIPEALKHYRPR
jgi:predicted Zn-dependent protease